MLPAYISHPDCIKHEMGRMHPESPDRIGAIHDMLLVKGLLDFMQTYEAPLATEQQLAQAHSMSYIHAIASMAPTEGYAHVDPDTNMNPYTYWAALRAAGAERWPHPFGQSSEIFRWNVRGSHAANLIAGSVAKYASSGVRSSRLE